MDTFMRGFRPSDRKLDADNDYENNQWNNRTVSRAVANRQQWSVRWFARIEDMQRNTHTAMQLLVYYRAEVWQRFPTTLRINPMVQYIKAHVSWVAKQINFLAHEINLFQSLKPNLRQSCKEPNRANCGCWLQLLETTV